MNSTISLFMSLVEGEKAPRPNGIRASGEQAGEKMCPEFREREGARRKKDGPKTEIYGKFVSLGLLMS